MQTSKQYNSCKTVVKNLQKLNTSSVQEMQIQIQKQLCYYNLMENLQIQVGVMETIILFIKTTTKGSKSLSQFAKT